MERTIKTKFDIGDKVYFICTGAKRYLHVGEVRQINILIERDKPVIEYFIFDDTAYSGGGGQVETKKLEHKLFGSARELKDAAKEFIENCIEPKL